MKTVHVHHDGQYWRGFKHGIFAVAIAGFMLAVIAGGGQSVRSQSSPTVNEIDPASVGPIRPLPAWFKNHDTVTLRFETIYDLDRNGMRPVPAAKAELCP